jgi:hypothetical protein
MSIFTIEEERQIISMYKDNINIDDIIAYFNVQEKDIRFVLKVNSIDRVYNTFNDELYDRIVKLYKDGNTQKYISEQLLISEPCIPKTLKKRGERIRTYSENNRRYALNQHYFDNIDTPSKAYILGILYADGCNFTEHNAITLSLQECDRSVVEFVKNEIEYEGPLRINELSKRNPKYKDQYILCINDEYMSHQLENLGVVKAKSLVLQFPDFLTDELIPHFIRGYFDGDGCVSYDEKYQKCYTKTAGTKEFCDKLSEILNKLNCKHHIVHPKQCRDSNTFVIQTCGNKSSLTLLSWIYENDEFHMERKYQKYLYTKEKYLTKK